MPGRPSPTTCATRGVRRLRIVAWGAIALAGWSVGAAEGHVAPSVNENNRYVVIEPHGDRLRLVYTVYFGETPGSRVRLRLDRNRNRQVDPDEGQGFADELAREVASRIELVIDGTAHPVTFDTARIGLGRTAIDGGSFAVDMVAWVCLSRVSSRQHAVLFTDPFELSDPGETELTIAPAPGIDITAVTLGGQAVVPPRLSHGFRKPVAAVDRALGFDFRATGAINEAPCRQRKTAAAPSRRPSLWNLGWSGAGLLGVLAAAAWFLRRRSRRHR